VLLKCSLIVQSCQFKLAYVLQEKKSPNSSVVGSTHIVLVTVALTGAEVNCLLPILIAQNLTN